jgi:transposase
MTKMPKPRLGRPSKYHPNYCDEIINFMATGYSVTAFAGSILVSRSTVYKWADEHPDFSDALNIGQARSSVWWENCLQNTAMTGQGNATAAIFGLKNRVAYEWRDKRELDMSSTDGSMSPKAALDMSKLSPEALAEIVALGDAPDSA